MNWEEINHALAVMAMWTDEDMKKAMASILKPEFKSRADEITISHSGGQMVASFDGWMIAYKECYLWIWRGNGCHIYAASKEEREGRISPEYVVFPSSTSDEVQVNIPI